MFYEVRVFDSRGQLKKVISPKKLSNRFWRLNTNAPAEYEEGYAKGDDWSSKSGILKEKICMDETL
ncbi:hypothetical protein UZ36_02575 [Candidatus Nitromaritima sp. SCGC AAA799-C22]|nr:hypothetical protein UZ36_02575 [Candidatus Nitromaritima sp. SCGC AAA799-C22]